MSTTVYLKGHVPVIVAVELFEDGTGEVTRVVVEDDRLEWDAVLSDRIEDNHYGTQQEAIDAALAVADPGLLGVDTGDWWPSWEFGW